MYRKLLRHGLIILFFLLFSPESFSQRDVIDSVKNELPAIQGKKKIDAFNRISKAYWSISPDSSLYFAQKALKLAESINNKKGISDAYNRIANAYYFNQKMDSALSYYQKSLKLREKIDDKEGLIQLYHNLAIFYRNQGSNEKGLNYYKKAFQTAKEANLKEEAGTYSYILGNLYVELNNYEKAIELFLKSVDYARKQEDSLQVATINNRIGNVYKSISSYDKALEYYLNSLKIRKEKNDKEGMAISYNSIGIIHERLKNYDKAKEYYNKTLDLYKDLGMKDEMAIVYNNLGIIYDDTNKKDTALKYYQKSYNIDKKANDTIGMSSSLNNIGLLYHEIKDNEKALEFLNRSLRFSELKKDVYSIANTRNNIADVLIEIGEFSKAADKIQKALKSAKEIKARDIERESYELFSKLYEATGNYKKSLNYYKKQSQLHDTIFSREKQNKISEIQIKYETAQKEKEIQLLKKLHRLEIKRQKNFANFTIALVALLVVLIILIYSRFNLKKKNAKILEAKNKQLEQANEKLQRSKENLRELNATKDKFFSIISHDLKNPFQALFGFSEALYKYLDNFSKEEIHEYSKLIYESAQNLYNLLQNLLQWSRSQLGSIKISPATIDVKHTIDDIMNLLKINANEKKITLKDDTPDDLQVYADEQVLSTIMRNLLSNAIKFTPSGGNITITSEEKENDVIITVADSGKGISEEEKHKLFKIDKSHTTSGTQNEKGTGLGLILCKELLDYSNGQIWAESSSEGGIFRFSLPKNKPA
jgi:signal transduction histidine kinase/Flp pilus assembly protein TadD